MYRYECITAARDQSVELADEVFAEYVRGAIYTSDAKDLVRNMGPFRNGDQFAAMSEFNEVITDVQMRGKYRPLALARLIYPCIDKFNPSHEFFVYNIDTMQYESYFSASKMLALYEDDIIRDVFDGNDFGVDKFADIIKRREKAKSTMHHQ